MALSLKCTAARASREGESDVIREVTTGKAKLLLFPTLPSVHSLHPLRPSLLSCFPLPHYIPKTIAPSPSPAASNLGRAKTNVFAAAAGVLEKRTKDREMGREDERFHFH